MIAFLLSPVGRTVLIALAVALIVGGTFLYVYGQGEAAGAAAVTATALAEAARRAAAAQRARHTLNTSQESIDADPYNRDRDPR